MTNSTEIRRHYEHGCSVRMTPEAAGHLRKLAHEYSLAENCDISVSDVIRNALVKVYGDEYRQLLK